MIKFIVDNNVGTLAKCLRMMGYDTLFFEGGDDSLMVKAALAQGRVILTKDTQIMRRRVVTSGRLKVVLIEGDDPELWLKQVIDNLNLNCQFRPFTLCLECNQTLIERSKEEVKDLVPAYVFMTQDQYLQCPRCQRVYWKGTHWVQMTKKLENFQEYCRKEVS